MRAGWRRRFGQGDMLGVEVSGRTLRHPRHGANRRAQSPGARAALVLAVVYSNRRRLLPDLEEGAEFFPDFRDMLPHCQVRLPRAGRRTATDSVINRETLRLLPRTVFVNTSRGVLMDETPLDR